MDKKNKLIGYICLNKDNVITHRICSIDYFPMMIFKTKEEALNYSKNSFVVKKVHININKKELQDYVIYD